MPSLRPTAIQTDESSSFRPIDAIGSASSQSPEPSAKEANNLALSTGSVVPLSRLSDSDKLQMRSSQFRCFPTEIGGGAVSLARSFHVDKAESRLSF